MRHVPTACPRIPTAERLANLSMVCIFSMLEINNQDHCSGALSFSVGGGHPAAGLWNDATQPNRRERMHAHVQGCLLALSVAHGRVARLSESSNCQTHAAQRQIRVNARSTTSEHQHQSTNTRAPTIRATQPASAHLFSCLFAAPSPASKSPLHLSDSDLSITANEPALTVPPHTQRCTRISTHQTQLPPPPRSRSVRLERQVLVCSVEREKNNHTCPHTELYGCATGVSSRCSCRHTSLPSFAHLLRRTDSATQECARSLRVEVGSER